MKKVMVVDDSKIMREIVKRTFDVLGYPVEYIEAGDGETAMQLLVNNDIDLILLDWNIPGITGIDCLKQIRAMEKFKTIPIIMVTSEASRMNIVEAVNAGATAYITKPFNENMFREKISKINF